MNNSQQQKEPKSLDELRPAPYNPRKISQQAAAALNKSLGDFGDLAGIVWNARTGNLVCGHQRVEQLRNLGGQLVDGAVQIASGERFPVRVVDWPVSREKTANVVANNPHTAGEFTDGIGDVLEEIKAAIGDVDFSKLALDSLMTSKKETDAAGDGEQLDIQLTYSVVVDTDSEDKQAQLLQEFESRGLRCRLLMF